LIAAAASLIQASHSIYYTFSAVAWTAGGLGSTAVGTLWAIGIGAEIIFFAVSGRLTHRPVALIGMGAAGAFLRWTVMGLNPPILLLPLVQCLHAFSFGATHLGSIQYAGRAAQTRQSATAQADFGAVLAFGGAATTAFSGVLYSAIGGSAYLVMAAMAGIGAMLLVIAGRLRR
jgi:PPP family 3-phenylpropionic acid transporter